jgi:hypothetical protein
MLMSASGTSRHFAVTQHSGRFWGEADINRQTKPAGSVENDPQQTSKRIPGTKFMERQLA